MGDYAQVEDCPTLSSSSRLTDVLIRSLLNFASVRAFRRVAIAGITPASDALYKEYLVLPDVLAGTGWRFPDPETAFSDSFKHSFATQMAAQIVSGVQSSIDAASLVFGHSILDDVASECCEISFLTGPQRWANAVGKRKVALEELHKKSAEEIYFAYLAAYIAQLRREPLDERMDLLNQKCQPVSKLIIHGKEYDYDRNRVVALDKQRQAVIHRVAIKRSLGNIETDLEFLEQTCQFVVHLVAESHGLTVDLGEWIKNHDASQSDATDYSC
jgi:hypothetical protein